VNDRIENSKFAMVALSRRRFSRIDCSTIVFTLVTAFVGTLSIIPVFYLVWSSFKPIGVGNLADFSLSNFTLDNFARAFSDPAIFLMFVDSFYFAAGSMLVAFFFGGVIAFLVERTDTPMRNFVYGFMFIPLIMPSMIKAIGWVLLLSPNNGILNTVGNVLGLKEPLFNSSSIPAMFWVEGLSMSPLTFLMLGAAFRGMDPSLEEAAYTSGAGKVTTFVRVTLRLMTPALAGIGLLQFVRGLEAFDVPITMGSGKGIQVFSTNIYVAVREISPPDYGTAFTLSLVLVALAVIGVAVYHHVMARSERYATVTGKGFRPRRIALGGWRWLALGFMLFFLFASTVLPFLVLLWVSFLPYYQLPSWDALRLLSLANYHDLFLRDLFYLSLKNTLIVSTVVSIAAITLATIISWIVIRLKPRGSRFLDTLAFLPYTVPGIAMGFSFMVVFLSFPNPIYGTLWILIFAYLTNFLPIATRFTHAALAQIRAELEEAAATSGAGPFAVLRRVTVPLILPSFVAGGLYVFLLSAKVVSAAAILWQPDSVILPVYLLQLWVDGRLPLVGALAVVMITGLATLTIIARAFAQRRGIAAQVSSA
jgi:iron(III) transport system permease protein